MSLCDKDTLKWRVLDIISWHGGGVEAHSTGELVHQLVLKVLSTFIFFATMDENFVLEFFRNDFMLKCYILSALHRFHWAYYSAMTLVFFEFIKPTILPFLSPSTHKCETFKTLSVNDGETIFHTFSKLKPGHFADKAWQRQTLRNGG